MSDEEITAAALADPDTVSPLEEDIFLTGKRGREALAELLPPEIAEGVLASRQGHPKQACPNKWPQHLSRYRRASAYSPARALPLLTKGPE